MKVDVEDVLSRLAKASGAVNSSDLARKLGVTPQALSQARSKGVVPPSWIFRIAEENRVTLDWIYFGVTPPPVPKGASVGLEDLFDIVEVFESFLQAKEKNLPPRVKAEVIRQLCQAVNEARESGGELRPGEMVRYVNEALAAAG